VVLNEEVTMAVQTFAERIEDILKNLRTVTPDVEGAVLVDKDGLPIASVLASGVDDSHVAAMAAAILGIGGRVVQELQKGGLNRVLIQGEEGYILFVGAGKETVLTVLTTERAKLGMIFLDANRAAKQIANLLTEREMR
jgi:predicted regulator of Ras-like GTPase activity (Roadblock/LC7/MglB family)